MTAAAAHRIAQALAQAARDEHDGAVAKGANARVFVRDKVVRAVLERHARRHLRGVGMGGRVRRRRRRRAAGGSPAGARGAQSPASFIHSFFRTSGRMPSNGLSPAADCASSLRALRR